MWALLVRVRVCHKEELAKCVEVIGYYISHVPQYLSRWSIEKLRLGLSLGRVSRDSGHSVPWEELDRKFWVRVDSSSLGRNRDGTSESD